VALGHPKGENRIQRRNLTSRTPSR
jgi:hypothetical protein